MQAPDDLVPCAALDDYKQLKEPFGATHGAAKRAQPEFGGGRQQRVRR
jgi:hypothetical protein